MSNENEGEAPATLTTRIIFDQNLTDDDIPSFLKQNDSRSDDVNQSSDYGTGSLETTPFFAPVSEDPTMVIESQDENALTEATEDPVEPTTPDLDELSVEELKQHQEEINRKIREKQEAEKKAVIDQIVNVVGMYKITAEELIEALGGVKIRRKGVKAKPKYRDPVSGAVWSGRGKEPVWIRGQDREKFLIENQDED